MGEVNRMTQHGHIWECDICGYRISGFVGLSYMYPLDYAVVMDGAKKGKYGKELKELLRMYPDAAIDPIEYFFQCQECGEYDCRPLLTAFIPKKGGKKLPSEEKRMWSVSYPVKAYYVYRDEMEEFYDLYSEYDHRCKKCRGKMNTIHALADDPWKLELICPHCKKPMEYTMI